MIGFIGLGVVGGATYNFIKDNLRQTDMFDHVEQNVRCYDPAKGFFGPVSECNYVFISVPVPTVDDDLQDYSILEESIKLCSPQATIFIRSTVVPGTCDRLAREHNKNILHMPEFLTERRAHHDMRELPIIIGNPQSLVDERMLSKIFNGKEIIYKSNKEAELIKCLHNSFLAIDVIKSNGAYELCNHHGVNWVNVKDTLPFTGFISPTHLDVPGHDGKQGYGGHCFPKDVKALLGHCRSMSSDILRTLLSVTDNINKKIRK